MTRRSIPWILVALVAASCGSGDVVGDTTSVPTTTTTTAATTTTSTSTTTTTSLPPTPLEELGYPVSDDWVVETVVAGIDSGTGGLAIDADGVLYQGDFGYPDHVGNAVYRITQDGTVETFASVPEMQSLTMTTFGPDGALYQSGYG
ncbi:MAG: hypothetical protein KJN71_08775, partial [Acidimicrobiia bacterium]|nr:hypothetical protein [Acidimicrobiia bacterium]